MRFFKVIFNGLLLPTLLLSYSELMAGEIRVAVASNFVEAMSAIARDFEAVTKHKVVLIPGATGKHYAQIRNGAPFEAFFAADVYRPQLLEQQGLALPGSRFTYAIGKLVLWSPKTHYVDTSGKVLQEENFRHLAIANPKLAPYGKAAEEVLQSRSLWDTIQKRLVRGENIGQTFQFVISGNAELGFVAYSQVKQPGQAIKGSLWEVPQSLYSPIRQQAVLLKENTIAREFLHYLKTDAALRIIRDYGYALP